MKLRFLPATLMLLGLATLGEAATFRVEVAYFDLDGGPLTVSAESATPLADGCYGQVLVDVGDDGIAPPLKTGVPGVGDACYEVLPRNTGRAGAFRLNGAALLDAPGCFWADPGIGGPLPGHRLFVRVWNAAEPQEATAYWDSPLYEVLPGEQQMIFTRGALLCHAFGSAASSGGVVAVKVPVELGVLGTYPNPFNSAARVQFQLPDAATVQLAIYDTQGRKVATLVDGPVTAGTHERRFDATGLPSGLYFASLRAGNDLVAVRKLLLVR